ncbi:cobW-domain-containing protein [Dentipellis sp. KUC8613]|nr:cobW-domain-containing protein [Dentipellis sp. KUC8613]
MPSDTHPNSIPITVFTGFLGAGKTSIILSLLPQLPKDYRVVLLKNEFGDVEVDSQLAKQSSLAAVSEILNGCMCCVLVGQMKTALLEILENYHPDRIIIECSGSAFPATLAFQIRELERETNRALTLDAIVTVIDAENFTGYEDTSTTARMQAQYTDVLLINKAEHVSERVLDDVIEHLNTLNDTTPKIRCNGRAGVDPSLIFGMDSKLFLEDTKKEDQLSNTHHDEVETVTVWKGSHAPASSHIGHAHVHSEACRHDAEDVANGDDSSHAPGEDAPTMEEGLLEEALSLPSKEVVFRIKGFVRLPSGYHIVNWAFGRHDLHILDGEYPGDSGDVIRLTVMGERGEVRRAARKVAERLGAKVV